MSWAKKGTLLSNGAAVTSLAIDGDGNGGYIVYFADGINLYTWRSATNSVATVIAGSAGQTEVGQVVRDLHSGDIFYTVLDEGDEEIWLY